MVDAQTIDFGYQNFTHSHIGQELSHLFNTSKSCTTWKLLSESLPLIDLLLYPKKNIPINEVTNIEPAFDGELGFVLEFFTKAIWYRSINYTLTVTDSFGNDGCEGSIARNESDVAVALVDYPTKHHYDKVNPMITLYDDPVVIHPSIQSK